MRVIAAVDEAADFQRHKDRQQVGWHVGPSVTNFILVDLGSPERAGIVAERLLSHGLVPRTFGAGHPLADHLRLTVRNPEENDRLTAAAQAAEGKAADAKAADATNAADALRPLTPAVPTATADIVTEDAR